MSLIEVVVALTIFSTALLGLARAGFVTSQTLRHGRSYMTEWTVAQSKLDSLSSLGWEALDGESGSEKVGGFFVTWEALGVNPREIVLVVHRRVLHRVRPDTFTTSVAKLE
jgi:Tfp pilus assembly protein PilV